METGKNLLKKGGLSYQKKLMLYTMIVGIVPIFILCILYMIFSIVQIDSRLKLELSRTSGKIANEVKSEMDSMTRIMKWILADQVIYDALLDQPEKMKSTEIMNYRYMKQVFENFQVYQGIKRIRVMVSQDTVYKNEYKNFFDMDYWQTDEELQSNGWLAGYKFNYPYEGSDELVSYYNLIYSYRSRKVTSIVFIDQSESRFSDICSSIVPDRKDIEVMIVTGEGKIVSAEKKDRIGKKIETGSYFTGGTLEHGITFDDKKMVSIVPVGGTDFYILEIASKDILNDQIKKVILLAATVGVITAGIAFIISMRIANSLSHRLILLKSAIDHHEECQIKGKASQDEMSVVIDAYNRMITDKKQMQQEVYEARLKEEHMKLMALQSQISPHFLYNILAGIKGAIELDRHREATEMISDLARFFQLVLSRGNEKISVSDEIEMIRKYLFLQCKVYAGQFEWEIQLDEGILPFLITKFTLQPLVENAVHHGIRALQCAGKLTITGGFDEDSIVIRITDNGEGIPSERLEFLKKNLSKKEPGKSTGYGLRNVDARLKLHFGREYGISIESAAGRGTTVSVTIPLEV